MQELMVVPKCYLCGANPGTVPKADIITSMFTSHSLARSPTSDLICEKCAWAVKLRCYYYNPNKSAWVPLFARGWSWLISPDESWPKFGAVANHGKFGPLPTVSDLPTRSQIREWLVNPPVPPFTICLAESGQKHIFPWAMEGHSQDYFPVQFEMDTLHIDRAQFIELLNSFEKLMGLGFGKGQIMSGDYRQDLLMAHLKQVMELDKKIAAWRGTRLLDLINYVGCGPTTS